MLPVGLKPNDWGFFDMLGTPGMDAGRILFLCRSAVNLPSTYRADKESIGDRQLRISGGGAFGSPAMNVCPRIVIATSRRARATIWVFAWREVCLELFLPRSAKTEIQSRLILRFAELTT